jgi:hypothetical protein
MFCQSEGHGYLLRIDHESHTPSTQTTVYKVHLHSMLQTQQGKLQIDGISTAAPSSPAAATITTE